MIRIYADFNNTDEQGRVGLNTVGSLEDLKQYGETLQEGDAVILYAPDEFEVSATLSFDKVWMARPDWATLVRVE
jgi:hypothetical protein